VSDARGTAGKRSRCGLCGNRGRWWWSIETRPKFADVTSDYVDTPEAGAKAIEKALMDIETSIRRARTK